MIRLVIVEDNTTSLASLRMVFMSASDIRLVGAYESAEEALTKTTWPEIDVLLTDLDLPGLTGPQLIATARSHAPGLLAIAHTVHERRESLFDALRAGATGYLVKGMTAPALIGSIRAIFVGETPISPVVAGHLINYFNATAPAPTAWEDALTSRELQVLRLFTQGSTYDEIAQCLVISRHTVHSHVRNIYEKLQVSSRKQAIRQALAKGYIKP